MTPHQKLISLKARTEANGCTLGEVIAAQEAIARLLKKHPHLAEPEVVFTFTPKPMTADEAIKAGMRKAQQEQAKAKPPTEAVVFAFARQQTKNATGALRHAARAWRALGWSRKAFIEWAVSREGYVAATASTQWQRSQTQD